MITEQDKRRLQNLKSDARLAPDQIKSAKVNAWRVSISYGPVTNWWILSAQLIDTSKSTLEDWGDLGRIAAVMGAPSKQMFERGPTEVQIWGWVA